MDIKKLDVQNIQLDQGLNFTTEENEQLNLDDVARLLSQKYGNLNIKITKARPKRESNRKPIFKYVCNCGNIIKSTEEELNITCNECNEIFVIS